MNKSMNRPTATSQRRCPKENFKEIPVKKNDSLHNLIIRIGSGDPSAFDHLYEMMREPLCNKILGRYSPTLSREDAEDAVQNAFMTIERSASGYRGKNNEASARKWINTIVFHEASRIMETSKRLFISLDDLGGTGEYTRNNSAVPERSLYKSNLHREGSRPIEDYAERRYCSGKSWRVRNSA